MTRTTRFLGMGRGIGVGIGGAITAPVLLVTLAGCGLANGGITVVGVNPGSGGVNASTPVSVVSARNANAAQRGAGVLSSASTRATDGSGGATGNGGAGSGAAGGTGTVNVAGGQGAGGGSGKSAAGSGTGSGVSSSAESPNPTRGGETGTSATGQGGDAVCRVADLRLRATLAGDASAGAGAADERIRHQQVTFVFTNISSSACSLRGYPNVDFLRSGVHGQLSEPNTFSAAYPVAAVELKPGGAVTATATFVTNGPRNAHGLHCDDAVAVRTFPPGSTVAISAGIRDAHGSTLQQFYVCGHGLVVTALHN